jgi:hypothetical protein
LEASVEIIKFGVPHIFRKAKVLPFVDVVSGCVQINDAFVLKKVVSWVKINLALVFNLFELVSVHNIDTAVFHHGVFAPFNLTILSV